MYYQRKNVNNKWFAVNLDKEEVGTVQTIAVIQGLDILIKINKTAAKNNIKLSDSDRAALLNFAGLTLESFTSDLIDAKLVAEKAAADKAAAAKNSEVEEVPF